MPKILIVDDDPLVRMSLADVLLESGYEVSAAIDGDNGLEEFARASFDLVVLDILMPRREGLETMREIRKKWSSLPVLAISGGDRTGWCDYLRMASDFGASDTMAKPFSSKELVDRVARLIGRAKSQTLA